MPDGYCDAAFDAVREVLAESLATGDDAGAAVAVYVDGRPVVDLWGGVADTRSGRPWARHTRCVSFSCTKAVTAAAALRLAERGRLELDRAVAESWPDFGDNGKDAITASHLLTHQAGLPAFDRPMTAAEAADPDLMAAQLAAQTPVWEPGTAHGYHGLTFGWLVGELVRRAGGRSVAATVRAEIGADLHLGVGPEAAAGLARMSAGHPLAAPQDAGAEPIAAPDAAAALLAAMQDPNSPLVRSTGNPAASFNNPVVLAAGWPAAGLVSDARALARFYSGLVDGSILRPETVQDATRERVRGPDRTLVLESAFGLGFMLPSANMHLPVAARPGAFGHPGASGALGLGDVERRVGLAYLPNVIRPALTDRRAYRLVEAVYAAL